MTHKPTARRLADDTHEYQFWPGGPDVDDRPWYLRAARVVGLAGFYVALLVTGGVGIAAILAMTS